MDIPAVSDFDAKRYMGDWYEVARIPGVYEDELDDVTVNYELKGNHVLFTKRGFREDRERVVTYRGPFEQERNVGEFRLKFLYDFSILYRVLWVSPDYDLSIVATDSFDHLWIYSRQKEISKAKKDELLKKIKNWGFDVSKIEDTPHKRRQ